MPVKFHGLSFDLPEGWLDITDDLPEGSPPSLARPTGAGVVQFSIARYRGGEQPNVTIEDLCSFLEDFCDRNGMPYNPVTAIVDGNISVETDAVVGEEYILAKYFSNRQDSVLATYICTDIKDINMKDDLPGVRRIVNSVEIIT